ncbi:Cd(II)/Pb(II)-responsive transcriptional regulator [Verminephrobacter eiseniae]|uniref:Cd(II)/Pb(II)-responsive transcriptional regulator n=1 Tax=Verminephrobacter eiseniae TaxID=364317 RepID=UPI002AA2B233|nr:Cd(II)/Pb(II)-responsive transcriptional regulator [Verminephrobacter eiseniae]MCW5238442.1 Cd(II)/Pb(II)-responsive transcriptional regulator [Verminephrobacter eiseniae]
MATAMRIGELGRATGVDIETIRYYEKIGLLPAPARSDNGYRSYAQPHLERLAFIRHCRALDISLADVKRLLDFVAQPGADCGDIDRLIDAQLARARARLKSMRALERQLAALRARCHPRQVAGECGILHELIAAAHGEACACHFDAGDDPAPAARRRGQALAASPPHPLTRRPGP